MSAIRIVLIEDHDLTKRGLRAALEQNPGVKVIGEAAKAIEGLKLIEMSQPDVAIVDIGLPDMDGIEFTQHFKSSPAARWKFETKLLILTMQNAQEVVLAAFAAGADSYCLKDTSSEKLLEALQVTHEGYSWIDPAVARIVLQQSLAVQRQINASHESKTVFISSTSSECSQILEASPLTSRELKLLELIVQGYSNAQIAQQLSIAVSTVKTYVSNILNKLCVNDRTQAAVRALRSGLIR